MKYITFDRAFKVSILLIVGFFVFLQYKTIDKEEIGRYQIMQFKERYVVLVDTKTGEVKMVIPEEP